MLRELNYREAISEALREEMRRDPDVFLIGEDIGLKGGAFYITKGFLEEFGPLRVVDATLHESNILGVAIGAGFKGMRAVAEMQFADFVTEGFKMIVNYAAGAYYRRLGPVPITVRLPSGSLPSAGPFHTSNPEAWFMNTPGLKMVCPSNPYDAKGLLLSSIRDDNPVLFLEYKKLYNLPFQNIPEELRQPVPEEAYTVPIGKAAVRREGEDVSVVTFGNMLYDCLKAAREAEKEGISAEVIDLRTLLPYDQELVRVSVRKTGKLLVAHEASLTGGVGGEFAARVAEDCFEYLDGPVRRIARLDTPIPFSPPLEAYVYPNVEKITDALVELGQY